MSYRVTCCECFRVFDGIDDALEHECGKLVSVEVDEETR